MAIITNVVQITVQGTVPDTGGQLKNIFNVFNYQQLPVVPNPAAPAAVVNAFLSTVWAPIAAQLSVAFTGVASNGRYLDDATNILVAGNVPANGAIALPRLPSQQSIVTPFRSSIRGKNFRGNKHFSPLATATVVGDEIAPASLAAWQALLPILVQAITASGQTYSPCVVSRSLSQLRQNPVTIQGATIITALLNKTIGTMRRRKEKTVR